MISFGVENEEIKNGIYLVKEIEEENNCITFIISVAKQGEEVVNVNTGKYVIQDVFPIDLDKSNLYKIVFDNYILHLTRSKSFVEYDDYEIRKGKYLMIFEKSRLLDCFSDLVNIAFVNDIFSKKYKHYGIYCLNHVIDIITAKEPTIEKNS